MSLLSQYPPGYLALLGLQSFGTTPKEVADFVQPVVDLTGQYEAAFVKTVVGIGAGAPVAGFNNVAGLTVPQGKLWKLLSLTASVSTEAGVTADVAPAITSQQNIRAVLGPFVNAAATQTKYSAAVLAAAPWIPSGTRIGAYLQNVTGVPTGASSVEADALIVEVNA